MGATLTSSSSRFAGTSLLNSLRKSVAFSPPLFSTRLGELLPCGALFFAVFGARAEEGAHVVGNEERRLEGPADVLFGGFDFGGAERLAVCLGRVVFARGAVGDVRAGDDERGSRRLGDGMIERGADGGVIVAVDALHEPAVRFVPLADVFAEREIGLAVDGDVVVVVEKDDVVEPEVTGEARRFAGDALHDVAVGGDTEHARRDERLLGVLKRAASILRLVAMPTALEIPCPRGPVVTSTPGVTKFSGWPGVLEPYWRKRLSSSIGRSYPERCRSE